MVGPEVETIGSRERVRTERKESRMDGKIGHHVEAWKVGHVHGAKHVLGVLVNLDALLDFEVDSRDIWDVVHAALTLLLLQLEGDSAHWALGDALHQVGKVSGNLVAESLGLDGCNLMLKKVSIADRNTILNHRKSSAEK